MQKRKRKRMQMEEFNISKEDWEEYNETCKKIGVRPRTYLRKIVKRETSRLKENLEQFKE